MSEVKNLREQAGQRHVEKLPGGGRRYFPAMCGCCNDLRVALDALDRLYETAQKTTTATRVMELHRTQHAPSCPCLKQLRINSSACTCGLWEADVALAALRSALSSVAPLLGGRNEPRDV